jgi:predicted DNA-binding protein (MmcQ/YjbR family)
MTLDEYNAYCASLPHSSHVVQWGGAHVWKIGSKVYAIAGWNDGPAIAVTFKCSPASYEILAEQAGLRPAPYLASRGMKWIQRTDNRSLDDAGLKSYIAESYRIVARGLPKRRQKELGLL